MKLNIKWEIKINEAEYYIELIEMNLLGKATLSVNGEISKYAPTSQSGIGQWVLFNCGKQECLLKINPDKKSADIFINGISLNDNPRYEVLAGEETTSNNPFASVELHRKVRNGLSSFFSVIILSIVNIFMVLFNSPISFPFSIFSTTLVLGTGTALTEEFGGIIITAVCIGISIAIIAFYAALYYFSTKSTIATWIAFAFLLVDTAGLVFVGFLSQDFASIVIDIAFHAWILWSVIQLAIARKKLTDLTLSKIPTSIPTISSVEMLSPAE